MTILQVYASTSDTEDKEADDFYSEVQSDIPKKQT